MGAVGGLLGTAGGAGGTGFSGPEGAGVLNPATVQQATDQYGNVVQGLNQQQQFLQAIQAQNGLQNQSNVYNQLQGVANGTGPNPAQAQLAQSTGANVANQAALMAGQRGSAANPALIARQAAQQGGALQQQSAGQAATLQAQQSLGALGQMGSLAGSQVANQAAATQGYSASAQGAQQNILNSIAAQNNANVGIQSNINSVNGSLANTTMGGQQNLIGGITGGVGSAFGLAEGGEVPGKRQMYANGTVDAPVSQAGSYLPIDPMTNPFDMPPPAAPIPGGLAAAPMPLATPATMGAQPAATATAAPAGAPAKSGPRSSFASYMSGSSDTPKGAGGLGNTIGKAIGAGVNSLFGSGNGPAGSATNRSDEQTQQDYLDADVALNKLQPEEGTGPMTQDQSFREENNNQDLSASNSDPSFNAAEGGKVPAMVSPGEKYLDRNAVKQVEKGANPMEVGEKIPGKAKVKGAKNDYANDTVPKTLESGGIVLPRSVTQAKHPHWAAHQFVSQIMAKQGKSLPKKGK